MLFLVFGLLTSSISCTDNATPTEIPFATVEARTEETENETTVSSGKMSSENPITIKEFIKLLKEETIVPGDIVYISGTVAESTTEPGAFGDVYGRIALESSLDFPVLFESERVVGEWAESDAPAYKSRNSFKEIKRGDKVVIKATPIDGSLLFLKDKLVICFIHATVQ